MAVSSKQHCQNITNQHKASSPVDGDRDELQELRDLLREAQSSRETLEKKLKEQELAHIEALARAEDKHKRELDEQVSAVEKATADAAQLAEEKAALEELLQQVNAEHSDVLGQLEADQQQRLSSALDRVSDDNSQAVVDEFAVPPPSFKRDPLIRERRRRIQEMQEEITKKDLWKTGRLEPGLASHSLERVEQMEETWTPQLDDAEEDLMRKKADIEHTRQELRSEQRLQIDMLHRQFERHLKTFNRL